MGSDLVFIGSNIPHLNFDYGIKTSYHQTVVQLKEDFLADALYLTPEFLPIQQLFNKAYMGLSFYGETKKIVSHKLESMQRQGKFEQLLSLLEVLQILAQSDEVIRLNEQDTSVKLFLNDKIRMGAIYKYIHANHSETTNVNEVAASVHLSTAAFCRYFKKQTKMTFTEFVNQYKITQAKTLLLQDKSVSEVCFQSGFESLSYFNKLFKKVTGENPSAFKKRYA
jgi:AraC-like DNA-binding protein